MPQSLGCNHLHIVFSTKDRQPFIDEYIEPKLYGYIVTVSAENKCFVHAIGGMPDHIHILVQQHRTISAAKLVEELKKHSSRWSKTQGPQYSRFSWQRGYGHFGTGLPQLAAVKNYILNQKQHHQRRGFKEEYRAILMKYGVEFDERYVWD